jgi:hypothetical protein
MQRPAIRARNHLDAVASDFPIGNVRPQGQLNVTGKFMTSDPACGQYPSFPPNQTDVAAIEGPQGLRRPLDYFLAFTDPNLIYSSIFALQTIPDRSLIVSQCMSAPGWDLAVAAAGGHDADYISAAQNLAPYADRIISIRIGWEMNVTGYPWTAGGAGSNQTPANYIATFRRMSNYMREMCGPDVLIDWCPLFGTDPTAWYPGDEYCDVIGMDIYAQTAFPQSWASMYESAGGLRWLEGFASAHGKFLSIPEWGCDRNNAAGVDFISNMARWMKRPRANRFLYQSFWNSDDSFVGKLSHNPLLQAEYIRQFSMPNS